MVRTLMCDHFRKLQPGKHYNTYTFEAIFVNSLDECLKPFPNAWDGALGL